MNRPIRCGKCNSKYDTVISSMLNYDAGIFSFEQRCSNPDCGKYTEINYNVDVFRFTKRSAKEIAQDSIDTDIKSIHPRNWEVEPMERIPEVCLCFTPIVGDPKEITDNLIAFRLDESFNQMVRQDRCIKCGLYLVMRGTLIDIKIRDKSEFDRVTKK